MAITINGSGTVTGISAGGLPDASIITADIADANITAAKLNGAQTGSAPIYGCRAWVNFDGTRNEADTGASTNGANVKIRASGNVTSVFKNAVGNYTANFTTELTDANYSVVGTASRTGDTTSSGAHSLLPGSYATGSVVLLSTRGTGSATDADFVNVAIFR